MKWNILLGAYSAFIAIVILFAYLSLIPTEIKVVPFYDSIGHFVLYGIWGYLSGRVLCKGVFLGIMTVPAGLIVVSGIAVIEECFQLLSPVRTFSFIDLGWGLLGIGVSWGLLKLAKN